MKRGMTIAVVDDHPIVREGLVALFRADAAFAAVTSAATGEELLAQCRRDGVPDFILSDVRMPGMDGFEVFRRLRRHCGGVKVVFLAGLPLKAEEDRARAEGASGYLPKSMPGDRLREILKDVAAGRVVFACEHADAASDPSLLTDREMAVLLQLKKGLTREQIAEAEHVSVDTIKTQVRSILLKLDVANSVAAVATAYERGILRA